MNGHWHCVACGTFDGPISGLAFCDVCADGSEVQRLVARELLERALELAAEGISYTPEYFRKKWKLDEEYDELKTALEAA